jgi:hypothetical protein
MPQIKPLFDAFGVIMDAGRVLPDEQHKLGFLEALAELEDNECHRTRSFPKTRLHRVTGIKQAVYHADIDKISGSRLLVQYSANGQMHLKDVISGQRHDDAIEVIRARIGRYDL